VDPASKALLSIGRALREAGYSFTTITPASHRRVNGRPGAEEARSLRDVFGWSRPFEPTLLPKPLLSLLEAAEAVERSGPLLRSLVRFSTLGSSLYVHSAFPTDAPDAVFFGPDTYRFLAFLRPHLGPARRVIDIGCGAGPGGLAFAAAAERVTLADISAKALRFAGVNAALAGFPGAEVIESDVLGSVEGEVDVILANPPYLVDDDARVYRHGGDELGTALSARIVREAIARLSPGGRLLVYTGAPVVEGRDVFRAAVEPLLESARARFTYAEIDPDVFGEELDRPVYASAGVERIAAVGLTATMPER
jgi:methylase of polypeptide subunit release factors